MYSTKVDKLLQRSKGMEMKASVGQPAANTVEEKKKAVELTAYDNDETHSIL